jgi:hypothetical protein
VPEKNLDDVMTVIGYKAIPLPKYNALWVWRPTETFNLGIM